jgi:hypothetical protein
LVGEAGENVFLLQGGRVVNLNHVFPDSVIHVCWRVNDVSLLNLNGGTLDSS